MPRLESLHADLAGLAARDRRRTLAPRAGLDFASNDYLALAGSPRLAAAAARALDAGIAIGSGGSRLLRGNHAEHEALEANAARFFGSDAALFFSTGFAANACFFATVPQRSDLIVYDALSHASVHEGLRLARAGHRAFGHNDAQAADDAIAAWRRDGGTGTPWLAVESLYSMDGDRAPIDDLAAVARRHDAMLVVDEAHATGVFGRDGRGLAAGVPRDICITLHTCGKALGVEGALLACPAVVRDFLVNRGRAFIFSTAPSPLIAAVVREALDILVDEPERRDRLQALVAHAESALAPCGVVPTGSQILPLVLGEDARAMAVAARLQARGFDVRGIRPPTVPAGTARLRLSLTLNVASTDVDALAEALAEALA
ncbi:8-amino-7-oxononanoate synthase [Hephaestia mangrovi]|uniref:8-amino-7-oxononanoate synthase n=1 Tax=Hephaestia mangrovi TaxID=2873268 RepID=UPI001CA7837D|nr:8-amino-7-oxononanoate synthase [Hephaestia mangrovi]MBY8828549.1 8-amino-7-oxononanoate synthase [Hephaestia mangrovi]